MDPVTVLFAAVTLCLLFALWLCKVTKIIK